MPAFNFFLLWKNWANFWPLFSQLIFPIRSALKCSQILFIVGHRPIAGAIRVFSFHLKQYQIFFSNCFLIFPWFSNEVLLGFFLSKQFSHFPLVKGRSKITNVLFCFLHVHEVFISRALRKHNAQYFGNNCRARISAEVNNQQPFCNYPPATNWVIISDSWLVGQLLFSFSLDFFFFSLQENNTKRLPIPRE